MIYVYSLAYDDLNDPDGIAWKFLLTDFDAGVLESVFPDFNPKSIVGVGSRMDPVEVLANIIIEIPNKEDATMFKLLYGDIIESELVLIDTKISSIIEQGDLL